MERDAHIRHRLVGDAGHLPPEVLVLEIADRVTDLVSRITWRESAYAPWFAGFAIPAAERADTRTAMNATVDLRYPIGRFSTPASVAAADRAAWLEEIATLPGNLRKAIEGLTGEQLDTPYRDGGWTVRQVVHHLADSHIHSYTRFRLALTEEEPKIKPYEEGRWAALHDATSAPPELSLTLLEALHARWVLLMRSLGEEEWLRAFRHPEHGRLFTLHETLAMYAWHSRHHVAHIEGLRERMKWNRGG